MALKVSSHLARGSNPLVGLGLHLFHFLDLHFYYLFVELLKQQVCCKVCITYFRLGSHKPEPLRGVQGGTINVTGYGQLLSIAVMVFSGSHSNHFNERDQFK